MYGVIGRLAMLAASPTSWKPPTPRPRTTTDETWHWRRVCVRSAEWQLRSTALPCSPWCTPNANATLAALTSGAIGVVYGDIGTSPLYALKEVFAHGRVPLTPENILGILSLVFWTLTMVVSLKYVVLILRADNNGEGGLIAMLALASQAVKDRPKLRRACCWWASSAPPSSSATGSSRRPSRCWARRGPGGGRARACTASWCRCPWWC
jgi:hypothetical protein